MTYNIFQCVASFLDDPCQNFQLLKSVLCKHRRLCTAPPLGSRVVCLRPPSCSNHSNSNRRTRPQVPLTRARSSMNIPIRPQLTRISISWHPWPTTPWPWKGCRHLSRKFYYFDEGFFIERKDSSKFTSLFRSEKVNFVRFVSCILSIEKYLSNEQLSPEMQFSIWYSTPGSVSVPSLDSFQGPSNKCKMERNEKYSSLSPPFHFFLFVEKNSRRR